VLLEANSIVVSCSQCGASLKTSDLQNQEGTHTQMTSPDEHQPCLMKGVRSICMLPFAYLDNATRVLTNVGFARPG